MATSKVTWYVVQVQTGRERAMCELIERVAPKCLVRECFTPRYQTQKKFDGEWRDVEQLLLPGYVIVDTSQPDLLMQTLRKIPDFTRLLTMGDRVVVTEGPLVGREALIKRVNRHKSLAILELRICGRTVAIKVGLGIVGKSGTGKDS